MIDEWDVGGGLDVASVIVLAIWELWFHYGVINYTNMQVLVWLSTILVFCTILYKTYEAFYFYKIWKFVELVLLTIFMTGWVNVNQRFVKYGDYQTIFNMSVYPFRALFVFSVSMICRLFI